MPRLYLYGAPCAAGASATRLGPGIRSQTLLDRREALPDRVLGHRARLDELEQVVRAAGLGADAREAIATEGLAADARPGDGAVHVEVPGAELVCRAPDAHRRAREEAARERVVGVVGERERVLEVVGAEHGEQRAEDLLARDARAGVARDDDHRANVPAARGHLAALADHLALVAGQRLLLAHAPVRLLVHQRPDHRADPHPRARRAAPR